MTRGIGLGLVALTAALLAAISLLLVGISLVPALGGGLLAAGGLLVAARRPTSTTFPRSSGLPRRLGEWATLLLLWGTVGLAILKMLRVPLWSWDHFAMWGVVAGHLDDPAGVSGLRSVEGARPELALPLLWRFASPLSWPATEAVVLVHVALAVALVMVLLGGLRRLGVGSSAAQLLAAWLAAGPLLWDTIFVGVADLPLALWTTLAIVLLLGAAEGPIAVCWPAAFVVGFLPWIKREGLPLALFLLASGGVLLAAETSGHERRARLRAWLLGGGALLGGHVLVSSWLLPSGPELLAGDWLRRGLARAPHSLPVLLEMAEIALAPAWLGFWAVFALALGVAARRRHRFALLLAAAVLAQIGVYFVVYLCAFPDPVAHVRASFLRLLGALAPAAMLAMGSEVAGAGDVKERPLVLDSVP